MGRVQLIIDVDEKLVCEGFERPFTEEERNTLIRAIGNGRSYNPTSDCISREALKDLAYINKGNFNTVEGIREWVDNAPAVESEITNDDLQAAMKESYHLGYGLAWAKFKKPQGVWECHSDDYIVFYTCSRCKGYGDIQDKFCKHCGAEMQIGDANG